MVNVMGAKNMKLPIMGIILCVKNFTVKHCIQNNIGFKKMERVRSVQTILKLTTLVNNVYKIRVQTDKGK